MGSTQSQENTYKQNQIQLNSLLVPKTKLEKAVNALNIIGGLCLFVIIVLFFYANKIGDTTSNSKKKAFRVSVMIFSCILFLNAFILWILNLVKNQKNSKTKLSNANLGLKIIKNILSAVVLLLCIFALAPYLKIQLGRYNLDNFSDAIFKMISAALSMLLFLIPGLFVLWNLNKKVKLQIVNKIRCDENISKSKSKSNKQINNNTKENININCENYKTYMPFNLYLAVQNVNEYNDKIIEWLDTKWDQPSGNEIMNIASSNITETYNKKIKSLLNNTLKNKNCAKNINTNKEVLNIFIKDFFNKKNNPELRQEIVNSILDNCTPLDEFSMFDGKFLLKNLAFFFAMSIVFSLNSKQIDNSVTRNSVSIVFLLIPIIYSIVKRYKKYDK